MKDKIIIFVIGFLAGAVVSTGVFYIYNTTTGSNQNMGMNGNQPPEMPSGQNGQPPEKPDGANAQSPEKPSENNSQSNTQDNN